MRKSSIISTKKKREKGKWNQSPIQWMRKNQRPGRIYHLWNTFKGVNLTLSLGFNNIFSFQTYCKKGNGYGVCGKEYSQNTFQITSNVNIFNIEIFVISQRKFYNPPEFEWWRKATKKYFWVSEWLMYTHFYKGASPLKKNLISIFV